jgi:hypothetical protein
MFVTFPAVGMKNLKNIFHFRIEFNKGLSLFPILEFCRFKINETIRLYTRSSIIKIYKKSARKYLKTCFRLEIKETVPRECSASKSTKQTTLHAHTVWDFVRYALICMCWNFSQYKPQKPVFFLLAYSQRALLARGGISAAKFHRRSQAQVFW